MADVSKPAKALVARALEAVRGKTSSAYPMAPRDRWYGDANYDQTGGYLTRMTPSEFLSKARPLKMDDLARDNIEDLKRHITGGGELDPLALYKGGKEDGRHRAIAAQELGIPEVPVLRWEEADGGVVREHHADGSRVVGAALNVVRKLNPLGLYSRAAEEAAKLPQAKGTGEQMRKMLLNQGAKPEELKWTGFDDWIKNKKSVTREEITDFLNKNQVQISETVRGADPALAAKVAARNERLAAVHKELDDIVARETEAGRTPAEHPRWKELEKEYYSIVDTPFPEPLDPKFSEYALPGGKNYREVIIQDPEKSGLANRVRQKYEPEINPLIAAREALRPEYMRLYKEGPDSEFYKVKDQFSDLTQQAGRLEGRMQAEIKDLPTYRSSHWDEPNPLAHVRFADFETPAQGFAVRNRRSGNSSETFGSQAEAEAYLARMPEAMRGDLAIVNAPGKPQRVLLLEEAQSDLGQAGKKVGFYSDEASAAANRERNEARQAQIREEIKGILNGRNSKDLSPEELAPVRKLVNENIMLQKHPQGVPSAPYVESTPGWTNVALRRALVEGARGDYDAIAWTPGKMQAARYPEGGAAREAGMVGYYDKILPTQVQKVLKDINETPQFGQIPVSGASEPAATLPSFNLTPEMREKIKEGLPLFTMMPAAVGLGASQMQDGQNPAVEGEGFADGGKIVQKALKAVADLFETPEMAKWRGKSVIPSKSMEDRYFHGTSKDKDFPKFNVGRHGVWLTKDPAEASKYALENDSMGYRPGAGWSYEKTNTASRVIPVFAKAENPYTGPMADFAKAENYKRAQSDWFDQLRSQGHDAWLPESNPDLAVILRDPEQVKSAISNTGDFSGPRIDREDGGVVQDDGFADGGHVEHALRLIQDQYPTHYLPNVGRQVMADGGEPEDYVSAQARRRATLESLGAFEDTPPMDPATMGQNWANAVERMKVEDYARRPEGRFAPPPPPEQFIRPREQDWREKAGAAIAGDGGTVRNRLARFAVGNTGMPDTGIGFGALDFTPFGAPLAASDVATSLKNEDYLGAALAPAGYAAYLARGPIGSAAKWTYENAIRPTYDAGRRAVDVAGDVLGRVPAPVAAGAAGAAAMTPEEAEAGKADLITKAARKVIVPSASQPPLFDYSRLGDVPHVRQFDLPRNMPARGVPPRVTEMIADPNIREEMLKTIEQGDRMGGSRWYNADPLREKFVEQFGTDRGEEAFRKYMDLVAATSPRSEVGANVRNASYYYNRAMSGQGMPPVGERNPAPYGHLAQRLHQMNAERVAGSGWDPLNNPKPASFVENLVGNQQPVTVDTHAFRLPAIISRDPRFLETAFQVSKDAPKQNIAKMIESGEISMDDAAKRAAYWQAQPKANEYSAMEQYYKSLGQELGLTPAQTQAAAWVGGGARTGLKSDESKPFLRFVEDRIYKTAIEKNMDPQDVMRMFVRGEMPLYASGGAVEDRAIMLAKEIGSSPRETDTP